MKFSACWLVLQWIDVTGDFNVENRRRLASTDEGRRRLGIGGSSGMFNFIDGEEDSFECVRSWGNETYEVTPRAPMVPYISTAYYMQPCWEPFSEEPPVGTPPDQQPPLAGRQ